ncbi:MAG: hypothetical protein IPP29_00805 [Bacteroidetes bacterium]|nr:hypothetical protein [Bacteroidota bacterium]
MFDEPKGWQTKPVADSPLLTDFENLWKQLKSIYNSEISSLAFVEIPAENKVADEFKKLMKLI